MAGRGSLAGLMPYSNANDVVVDMAKEVIPVVKSTPVIAGVCGTDPFKDIPRFLKQLKDLGFAGMNSIDRVRFNSADYLQESRTFQVWD